MKYDKVLCRLLRHVCRESSDPAAPELCREYLGDAARVFQEGRGAATELARVCAEELGLVVAGETVYLREAIVEAIVDSAAWLARRYYELLFKDVEPGLLAARRAPGEPPLDPVAALNAVIAAYISMWVDGAVVMYTPCPYKRDATHNPLIVAGEPSFKYKVVVHAGCVVGQLKDLSAIKVGSAAVYDGSVVRVSTRDTGSIELRPGEVLRLLGVRRGG